jgi:hypothetical protein
MVENSCRYLANPEKPCVFASSSTKQHEHVMLFVTQVLRDIVGSPNPIYKVKLLRDHQGIGSLGHRRIR